MISFAIGMLVGWAAASCVSGGFDSDPRAFTATRRQRRLWRNDRRKAGWGKW